MEFLESRVSARKEHLFVRSFLVLLHSTQAVWKYMSLPSVHLTCVLPWHHCIVPYLVPSFVKYLPPVHIFAFFRCRAR